MARARTTPKQAEPSSGETKTKTKADAEPGTKEHLGDRPYADEPLDWEDNRPADERPGTSEHLGEERPYAGPDEDAPKDDRPASERPGTSEHLGESPYAGAPVDE